MLITFYFSDKFIDDPYLENEKEFPKCVQVMFDPSVIPRVPLKNLSLTIPMKEVDSIIGFMEATFIITPTWDKVKEKIFY